MVSLKNGVSDLGGLPMARVVLEISWFDESSSGGSRRSEVPGSEVSFIGGSGGSALSITALGLASLTIGPSGLTKPDTQVVLFIVGVETAIVAFPTWEMGKRRL